MGELCHFYCCRPSIKVSLLYLFWELTGSPLWIYRSLCLNPHSCAMSMCPRICISQSSLSALIEYCWQHCLLLHHHVHLLAMTSAGPYVIIILYTDTGSVFRLGGSAGAKRGAGRWPGIGEKRKHATASSHIFWILTSHQLIKTTHAHPINGHLHSMTPQTHLLSNTKALAIHYERHFNAMNAIQFVRHHSIHPISMISNLNSK